MIARITPNSNTMIYDTHLCSQMYRSFYLCVSTIRALYGGKIQALGKTEVI
jgi:hypothetical protein